MPLTVVQPGIGGTGLVSPGTSGNVLTSNGTVWVSSAPSGGGGQFFGNAAVKAIAYNAQTIAENLTVTAGNNGYSAGPITVSPGFTVTVQPGSRWVII
jgi:hypothetical protein